MMESLALPQWHRKMPGEPPFEARVIFRIRKTTPDQRKETSWNVEGKLKHFLGIIKAIKIEYILRA